MAARKRTDDDGGPREGGEQSAKRRHATVEDALATLLAPAADPLSVEDEAYRLHLRGHSLRDIARRLGIDRETAGKYVRTLAAADAPRRRATRDQMRVEATRRLRHVQETAWTHYSDTGDLMALTIVRTCEQDITRLRGLLDTDLLGEGVGGGISITITKHAGTGDQGGDA